MRIDANQTIAGLPTLQARRFMRMVGSFLVTPAGASEILRSTEVESRRFLLGLGEEGYMSQHKGERWQATVKGVALAGATAAKPLRRATVDRLVSELLVRVREVNGDGQWAYKVKTIVLFGSVVTKKLRPSDIDVACSLIPRWHDRQRQRQHEEERRQLRTSRFANDFERVYWPEFEILRFLKARSRGLSVHLFDDWIRKNTKHEVIYQDRRARTKNGSWQIA